LDSIGLAKLGRRVRAMDEIPTCIAISQTTARLQKRSGPIRSKGDRHPFGHGPIGILSWFRRFDNEREQRLTEREQRFTGTSMTFICEWIPGFVLVGRVAG
jgi:hypothetical protein